MKRTIAPSPELFQPQYFGRFEKRSLPRKSSVVMTKPIVFNWSARKRTRACGPRSFTLCILGTVIIVAYACISVKLLTDRTQRYFSALSDRDKFVEAIEPFTNLRFASRIIARPEFLEAEDLEDSERDLLRFFITEYLAFHRASFEDGTPRLVYRPREVGNGDRFDCMIFAYWAAVLSRRIFVLDWNEPFPLSLFFKSASKAKLFLDPIQKKDSPSAPEMCTLPDCILLTHLNLKGNQYEKALLSKTRTVVMHTHKLPLELDKSSFSRHLPKHVSFFKADRFRNSQTFRRAVLHHVITMSDSMVTDHSRISKGMRLATGTVLNTYQETLWWRRGLHDLWRRDNRRYIGVHARLGKGVGEFPTERFKYVALKMKEVAACLASRAVKISEMSGRPPIPIFLATDTAEFREIFERAVKQTSRYGVDVLYGNWSMIHVAKVPFKDRNYSGRGSGDPWEAVWGGFMDLTLLGHAEHIVALYSGFPRLAMSLGVAQSLIEIRNELCLSDGI